MNWNDTITLTFGVSKFSDGGGVKVIVPKSFIKGLKQGHSKDYTTNEVRSQTLVLMDIKSIRALNMDVTVHLSVLDKEEYLHEFKVEEEFQIVLGLLQNSPAAKILHGESK